ncbi:MAG: SDR family NAD(P)-dependent oxidoreductase [Caldilineaceae bacterium]|nr:SDR family NAD(P)-dependent oxidoreductase [Caldilineaceae bacterium]
MSAHQPSLKGQVAVVAGATRGAGRAIAIELGAAGTTVYCTGRSVRGAPSDLQRRETIDETAELVTAAGGVGIAVQVDHSQPEQVEALFQRVAADQDGRLDILVNDVWGGEGLMEWKPFWEMDIDKALLMISRAVFTHIITSRYGGPLMAARNQGLIIEITDGDTLTYRGNLAYDMAKTAVIRLALAQAEDLKARGLDGVTALALTPGFLRSEQMLDHFGVTAETWRDAIAQDPYFAGSETPHYIGRAVVALATDPNVHTKAGQAWATWTLSDEYDFTDLDGSRPHWGRFFAKMQEKQGNG